MSYSSTNGTFAYTITNNTSYVIEQLDHDIILSAFNRWDNIMTIDSRFGSSYTITISFIIDTLDAGVLGGASITSNSYITNQNYGNIVPLTANITMNNTYIGGLKTTVRNDGYTSYYHVLLHEIGHILGIGSFWYLTGCPKTSYDDNGTTKYYYTGTNAFREYKLHFGNNTLVGVPIEDDGGAGTAGVHPEEGPEGGISSDNRYINGIFHPGLDTELMTGWLDGSPVSTPLSRITLGFLEDMGYTVNYNLADVYIMSWLQETEANNLEQTYIKGFLDVSGGHIINRNGNLSILQGTMDVSGAVAFNSRLDVGGDVSLNGTTIDICGNLYAQYPDNSIPSAAIDGLGDVTPNFVGNVDFGAGVTILTKAAIGSTTLPTGTTTLKVTGDLDFTGNLLNDGVAFSSGVTELDGLSDVKAGGTNFGDSILIGHTTTGTLVDASYNIGMGVGVFNALTEGDGNVAIGHNAANKLTTGTRNISVGIAANALLEDGKFNTTIGGYAAGHNVSGEANTCCGYVTGGYNIGNYNTFLGYNASCPTSSIDLSGSTAIGANAIVTASNQIMLGTTGANAPSVVIPGPQLDVAGDISFSGDLIQNGTVFSGGSNVFDTGDVSMNTNLNVGGNTTVNGTLNTGPIAMGGHIHPTTNAAYDLGNAEYKIRHCFLSDNSLWVGDDHKVDIGGGKMKFKKRNKNAVPASIATAGGNAEAAKASKAGGAAASLSELTLLDWLAYAKNLGESVGGTAPADISIQDIYSNSNDADYENIQHADNTNINYLTINPIDVSVDVPGIQGINESLKFTIPNSMTALKYFCIQHSTMIGDFTLASSSTETDKTYYVRMVDTDPATTPPYYLFSDTNGGTALNDANTQLTLYKGNTYTFIKTDDIAHPFMVGDSWKVTTGIKLTSTGIIANGITASTYTNPYTLHVNGMANIENNLNVARALTVSGPIRQW